MKTTKYTKKKHGKADPSSIYKTMSRIQLLTPVEQLELSLPPRTAFEALRSGRGTESDFHTLAAVSNCVFVCGEEIGESCVDAAKQAQESLLLMLDRWVRLGRWGLDAGALQSIPVVLDLYEQLLALYTPLQMQAAMRETIRRMKVGETLTVEDFKKPQEK